MNSSILVWLRASLFLALIGAASVAHAQTILPDATVGQAYSFQLLTNPAQPAGAVYSVDTLPTGLSLNASTGLISGVTSTVGTFKGNLSIRSSTTTTTFPFQITVDPANGSSTITSSGGAVGTVGSSFSYTLTASNNPTSFNIAQLPPGLTASGAVISGTPTTAGLYFTSVSANNASGQGAVLVLMFTISAAGPLPTVTSGLLVSSPVGSPVSYTITGTNSPTSFSATGLPTGLSLNASTGVISGTPTTAAVTTVPITAKNAFGSSVSVNLIFTIGSFSAITSPAAISATVGQPISYTLTASNTPFTFAVTGLPAGLSYNTNTGVLSGTPSASGVFTLSATATNSLGVGAPTTITLTVTNSGSTGGSASAPVIVAQPQPISATIGSNVIFSVTAAGTGALTYQWSVNNTPITGQTGPILDIGSVQPTDAGTYMVTVANASGTVISAPAALTIQSLLVPPAITAQPNPALVTVGGAASFTVGASGSAPLSYQWMVGSVPIAGATSATLALPVVSLTDAGTYSAVVTNAAGKATTLGAVLTVSATPTAPIFQFQPASTTVGVGGTASFSVGVVGTAPITYQWLKSGVAISGATASYLTFPNAQPAASGTYSVVITDPAGSVTSSTATLTVPTPAAVPVPVTIIQQPVPVTASVHASASFSVAVNGDATLTYQWRKNQENIPAGTNSSFTVSDVQPSDSGAYDVVVSNAFSAITSFETPLTVVPVNIPSRLTNISVLGSSGLAGQGFAVGFVVGGSGTETTLVRAVGPTLSNFGLKGLLADPELTLFASGQSIATNDNWGGTAALTLAFQQTGAFALPATSLDSALIANLPVGSYTAQVQGTNNGTGVVLLEAYDDDTATSPTAHFVNVSARGVAGSGSNVLTIGFAITGTTNKSILIRGAGPTLASYFVSGVLAHPQITVFDSSQNVMGTNTVWGGSATLTAAFNSVLAFPFPATSQDSALLLTLSPGAYSVQLTSSDGSSGVGLLEVYELQ